MAAIKHSDFSDLTYQASIFLPHPEFISYKILSGLFSKWEKTLDGQPEILPDIPRIPNANIDIPTLILKSQSEEWKLEFSASRMNFYWNRLLDNSNDFRIELFPNHAFFYLSSILELFNPKTSRLAFVVKRHLNLDDAGVALSKHFCQEKFLNSKALDNPSNFELHSHKVYTHHPLPTVNSWFRCKTVDIQFSEGLKKSIFIEQDINTLAENTPSSNFDIDQIKTFFGEVSIEMQKVLEIFFPKSDTN